MTVQLPAPVEGERPTSSAISVPSTRRNSLPFVHLPSGEDDPAPLSSSWLEIRLFYVRVSPCASGAAPPFLALTHLRRDRGAALEINSERIPESEPTTIHLRRNCADRDAADVTYISTDGVRVTGAIDFEVSDDQGNLMLCGSLDRMDAPWSNGAIGFDHHQLQKSDRDPKTGWSMDCYLAASIGSSVFVQPSKSGLPSSPSIEVYVTGCFAAVPLILTQTFQLSPRWGSVRLATLGAIPEDEEATDGEPAKNYGLESHKSLPSATISMATVRSLKIKTATCKRILKELRSYEKEVEKEADKTADMKETGAGPYDLKQQENVLAESRMMVPDCSKRLEASLSELKGILAELKEQNLQAVEIEEADNMVVEVEAFFKATNE